MTAKTAKIRLFVETPLAAGAAVALPAEASHYLLTVMRARRGDGLRLFNGCDGEWSARIVQARRGAALLEVESQARPQRQESDLWLLFAPIKRAKTDLLVEKATELGVSRLMPVLTERTIAERVRRERLCAIAREAAEQCERLTVPEIAVPTPLSACMDGWPPGRALYVCDPTANTGLLAALRTADPEPRALLIGPEGGFGAADRGAIARCGAARRVALGPRILRTETAAIAALTILQASREQSAPRLQ